MNPLKRQCYRTNDKNKENRYRQTCARWRSPRKMRTFKNIWNTEPESSYSWFTKKRKRDCRKNKISYLITARKTKQKYIWIWTWEMMLGKRSLEIRRKKNLPRKKKNRERWVKRKKNYPNWNLFLVLENRLSNKLGQKCSRKSWKIF